VVKITSNNNNFTGHEGKRIRAESASLWPEEREMSDQVLELGMRPLKWRKILPLSRQMNENALGVVL
jgi:hypothetical protein